MLEPNKIPMTCIYQARTEDPDHLHSIVATKDACDSRMMYVKFLSGQTLGYSKASTLIHEPVADNIKNAVFRIPTQDLTTAKVQSWL